MIRVHCFGFAFTPKLIPTVLLFITLPLLISLGFWQLHRAEEKRALLSQFQKQKPLTLNSLKKQAPTSLEYRTLKITGHYDSKRSLFLDNKILQHRVGFEVITPFIPINNHKIVFVNRGWIPSMGRNNRLPNIKNPKGLQTIEGFIKMTPKKSFVLSQDDNFEQWPALVQAINQQQLEKRYNKPFYPFIVLLSPKSPGTFKREWHPVVISPAKHLGYAIQWFSLALTFVIIYLVLNTERGRDGISRKRQNTK